MLILHVVVQSVWNNYVFFCLPMNKIVFYPQTFQGVDWLRAHQFFPKRVQIVEISTIKVKFCMITIIND